MKSRVAGRRICAMILPRRQSRPNSALPSRGATAPTVWRRPMAADEVRRIRQELEKELSEGQVELLRALRSELSSQRWQVMLEIDGAQEDLQAALRVCSDASVRPGAGGGPARFAR